MNATQAVSASTTAAAAPEAALRAAESSLGAAYGIPFHERWVRLARPDANIRLLEAGDGPPTLHVHGGGAFGSISVPLAAALPGRRHLLLDRPGFGLSERADVSPDFRARSIELLASTLDALDLDRVDLVGNSIGAAMGLWFALAHPERVHSLALVGGVAMIGPAVVPLPLRMLAMPGLGPLMLRLEPPSDAQVHTLFRRFGQDPARLHPTLLETTLAAQRVPAYARAWLECLQATISLAGTRPGLTISNAELKRLSMPMAFAWGHKDPMADEAVGRAVAAETGARFTVVGVGHCPWLEDPAGVARAIEPVLAPRAA